MANTNKIDIRGYLPFDIVHRNEAIKGWFARFASPCFGFQITYDTKYRPTKFKPNQFGGQTAFFYFEITGEEAVWQRDIAKFVKALIAEDCEIFCAYAWDVDNKQAIATNLLKLA
jgi:hypothetical protein